MRDRNVALEDGVRALHIVLTAHPPRMVGMRLANTLVV